MMPDVTPPQKKGVEYGKDMLTFLRNFYTLIVHLYEQSPIYKQPGKDPFISDCPKQLQALNCGTSCTHETSWTLLRGWFLTLIFINKTIFLHCLQEETSLRWLTPTSPSSDEERVPELKSSFGFSIPVLFILVLAMNKMKLQVTLSFAFKLDYFSYGHFF